MKVPSTRTSFGSTSPLVPYAVVGAETVNMITGEPLCFFAPTFALERQHLSIHHNKCLSVEPIKSMFDEDGNSATWKLNFQRKSCLPL